MNKISLFQILFLSILVSACAPSSSDKLASTIPPTNTIEYTKTPATIESPTITLTASITPAAIKELSLHNLALNESNVDKVKNLITFDLPGENYFYSSFALGTRNINGQTEYLLAFKDFESHIQIWNIIEEKTIQTLEGINAYSILFHPDKRNLVAISSDEEVAELTLVNIQNGSQQIFFLDSRHAYDDRHISINQNGLNFALFTDSKITEFDLQTTRLTDAEYDFPFYRDTTPPYTYSPTGNLIAVTHGYDEKLHLLDLTNQKDVLLEFPFTKIIDAVTAEAIISRISIDSNEKYIVGGALNGTIYLWDFTDGVLLNSFKAHEIRVSDGWVGGINTLNFSPQSNLLVSVGYDGFTKLWDVKKGVLLKGINTLHYFGTFTEDGRYFVAVGEKGVEIWGLP